MKKREQLLKLWRETEARGAKLAEAIGDGPGTAEQRKELGQINAELEKIQADLVALDEDDEERGDSREEIERFRRAQRAADELDDPLTRSGRQPARQEQRGPRFDGSIGQLCRYVIQHGRNAGAVDADLQQRATGMSIGIDSDGGFLVPEAMSTDLMTAMGQGAVVRPLCTDKPVTIGNSMKINVIDETSRATGSRYGGLQVYTAAEAGTVSATKPKFRQVRLEVEKVMGLLYLTEELMADAAALEAEIRRMMSDEFAWQVDDYIINGDGSGKPLGWMNSPAKVIVSKETNQKAGTIVYENVSKMWDRVLPNDQQRAYWLRNQNTGHQLRSMVKVVGTGGIPVYMPASGLAGQPYETLFGRPVIPVEQAQSVGTEGDLQLVVPRHYWFAQKGGMDTAASIHVQFVAGETVLRFTIRIDGKIWMNSAITPANGSDTLSPIVTLETRS